MSGLGRTLMLSAVAVLGGTVLGALICLLKMSKFPPFRWITTAYIEVIRGTPLLLQLYFFTFLLPALVGAKMTLLTCVLIALVLNSAAYVAEIIRSGIQAVDSGQGEAARSLGLSQRQTMTKIVLPQAIKNILPSLVNEFIMVIKETSLASTFFIGDLMTKSKTLQSSLYMIIEPFVIVGVIYFVITFTLSKLVGLYERRLAASD